jgi:hypothetical protein
MTAPLPRGIIVLSVVAATVVVVQLARMSVYMARPDAPGWSVAPWNPFTTTHSCLAGYWAAARQVDTAPDVWSDELRLAPPPAPGAARPVRKIGPFPYDAYEYTPTYLLLPRALSYVAPDFFALRRLWFGLNVVVVLAAVWAISRRLVPAAGPAVVWLAPLVLAPMSVLSTFQIGNVQLACIAASLLAMLAFERARAGGPRAPLFLAGGGLLLAFMTVSKLFPGMLVFYLLLRRDWAAVAWTAGIGLALALLGLADLGLAPHQAFLQHLPRLLSGEAFPNLNVAPGIAANMSVPGLVRKLSLYGLPYATFDAMRVVGWLYTAVLLVAVVRLAQRPVPPAFEPVVWIAILLLATLRSPALPVYGIFPVVWLAAIVLAARWHDVALRVALLVLAAVLVTVAPGQTLVPPTVQAIFSTIVQTGGAIAIVVTALRVARYDERRVNAV